MNPTRETFDPSKRRQRARALWFSYMKRHKGLYVFGAATVLLTNAMQVFTTRGIGLIIDFFTGRELPQFLTTSVKSDQFVFLFCSMIAGYFLLMIGRMGWRLTLARQTHVANRELKEEIWNSVRYFRKDELDSTWTKGVLMNASTSDAAHARLIYGFTQVAAYDVLFLGILATGTMLTIHVPMTCYALAVMLLLPWGVKKLSDLEIERYVNAQEMLGRFNDLASQVVSTIRLQRLTQTGPFWEKRMGDTASEYREIRLKAVRTSLNFIPMMGGGTLLSYIVLFGLGLSFVFKGEISVGDFLSLQALVFLLQDPLMELGFIISEWKKSLSSLERLQEIYEHPTDTSLHVEGDTKPTLGEHSKVVLAARNLSFKYPGADKYIFKDLDLELRLGERLGVIGPIGSGKTTLLQVLSGLSRDNEGEIFFEDKSFQQFSHQDLRQVIAYVHQKPFLFADSIRANIEVDRELTDEEVWFYLELAGLKKDVLAFNEQLETPLGEWGINLSGGQKQRLTLARALARRPKILFLDDCLSAVDTVTEEFILKNLDRELKNTTLVWVAHRESTLKYCDRLFRVGDDEVSEVEEHHLHD